MSVINKVLRDLDSRAAVAEPSRPAPGDLAAVVRGTSSVPPLATAPAARVARAGRGRVLMSLAGLVLALAGLWVWWQGARGNGGELHGLHPSAVASAPFVNPQRLPEPIPVAAPPTVTAAASAPALPLPAVQASATALPVDRAEALPALTASGAPVRQEAPPALVAPQEVRLGRPAAAAAHTELPVAEVPRPRPPALSPTVLAEQGGASWQDAALETVGQAQRLWNGGGKDAAVELLREALAGLERAHGAELGPSGAGAKVSLAMLRELARMELQQGQHAELLADLKRYERVWVAQADVWAVRGNVAQRLGQHVESSQSYLMALKIRPGEPRWMLGAAVSLAAQGQVAQAADLAEQARALTSISADVLTYLRQMGVTVRDRQ